MSDFDTLAAFKAANQRKALVGAVFVADHSAAALADIATAGPPVGKLDTVGISANHKSLGKITADGITMGDSVTKQEDRGWGDSFPSRVDVESEDATMSWVAMESNKEVFDAFFGVDMSAITPDPTTGTITFDKPKLPVIRDKRALALFMDNNPDGTGEFYFGFYYLRCNINQNGDQTAAFTSPGFTFPLQASALADDAIGSAVRIFMGGPGMASLLAGMGFA